MNDEQPDIQLISNLVIKNTDGEILFVKYDTDDDRWWLPGGDLDPYQHPDECAKQILDSLPGLKWSDLRMVKVQSFRGRRGWHVMFDYLVTADGQVEGDTPASWFSRNEYPRTKHGRHETDTVEAVLATAN
jgi:ADP-ribose pyrophosphatase YjhB (NUDIX family)